MKFKILALLGLWAVSTQSNYGLIETGHVSQSLPTRNSNKKDASFKIRQHFCSEGKIQKKRCSQQGKNLGCNNSSHFRVETYNPVCVYDRFGVQYQFNRQCQACEHQNTQFYFDGKCENAPTICAIHQGCVNGVCIDMLGQVQFSQKQDCNVKSDCLDPVDICVANKCIDKRTLFKQMRKEEKKHPQIAKKNQKIKEKAKKLQQKRQQKDYKEHQKVKERLVRKQVRRLRREKRPEQNVIEKGIRVTERKQRKEIKNY